ncbi:unnamed protein product [Adineta ricciae]|uniref:NADP-dependent oxidoreductase domain-containing protein n=1 Tax=Adineta ricciae TaxID=249248 RepID=A0A815L6E1_ADIRI|nr:unnamed protein product [Adineta ricciae]CAF1417378.1 unnamed protein product [Adineta ricciae]
MCTQQLIPKRQLGKSGPLVSAIGFGMMGLSGTYGAFPSDEERFKILDQAIELGCTHFDTSDIYGDSEDLLGKYFKKYPQQREKIFLATKFALIINSDRSFGVRNDGEYVRQAIEKSLNRLQLDYVDLYYVHSIDSKVPIEEAITVLKELVQNGKIKYIGLSECSSDTIRRASKIHQISAVQIEYSPFSLDIEKSEIDILKTCQELGIAVVCGSPLGRGILTGQIKSHDDLEPNDIRRLLPRFSKENFPKNLQVVELLNKIAKKKNCTTAQLTLAWTLAQGEEFFVIPGTKRIKTLEENANAANVKLTEEEIREIREVCENADICGGRLPEKFAHMAFGNSAPLKN